VSRFVLVHGAWHGAWCWRHVATRLRAEGHDVVTPTLKGVGERSDELTGDIRLDDHIADVAAALAGGPSILVGHSYAGLIVREVADRMPDDVSRVVLVDGWAGAGGASLFQLAPDWFVEGLRSAAADRGDGWYIPAPPAQLVGVTEAEQVAWVEANLTAHPLRTFEDETCLDGAVDAIPGTAVICRPGIGLPFEAIGAALDYDIVDIESGHDAMVIAPHALAEILLALPE
jgi:pimeloyl-ACP methyl ester carboxylesterase